MRIAKCEFARKAEGRRRNFEARNAKCELLIPNSRNSKFAIRISQFFVTHLAEDALATSLCSASRVKLNHPIIISSQV